MLDCVLERRPLYGIGTVARLTGLKPDTLRVWERRYGLGASCKSASGRRQYTQGDLEHLQLIAALVNDGARIGEIANAERKTLESLLNNTRSQPAALPETKPKVVFVGMPLCDWVDQHQGCLAGVDAMLVRTNPGAIPRDLFPVLSECDAVLLFFPGLNSTAIDTARRVREELAVNQVLLTHEFANRHAEHLARDASLKSITFPPDPALLALELGRSVTEKLTHIGRSDVGELVQPRPREFSPEGLSAAVMLQGTLGCECPRHIAHLVESLGHFEDYSADCSAENWQDAAVHARVYAFTAQARWLMERALQAILEDHEEHFAAALERVKARGNLGDAA